MNLEETSYKIENLRDRQRMMISAIRNFDGLDLVNLSAELQKLVVEIRDIEFQWLKTWKSQQI